jgi:hypothetical protein
VKQRISDAISSHDRPDGSVRLVAVSKTKPLEFLKVAYEVRNIIFAYLQSSKHEFGPTILILHDVMLGWATLFW